MYGTFNGPVKAEAEHRSQGRVALKLYWKFFRSGNGLILLLILVLSFALTQTGFNGSDYWLKLW
jgi:hypothetical protein